MIKTDKILSPILWLCGISTPFFLTGAYAFRNVPTIFPILIITAIVPIGIACIIYIIFFSFTTFSPEKLLSEDDQHQHGNPINKPPNAIPNPNLHADIDTLIERRISDAIYRLRDLNQSDLKDLNLKHTKPWQVWSISTTVFITAFGIISYFIAPQLFYKKIDDYIQKKFIDTPFKDILSDKAKEYMTTEFSPLKTQLKIQQFVLASKAGRYDKYLELKQIISDKPEYAEDINTALREIDFYYDALKYQLSGPLLSHPDLPIDEIIDIYRNSDPKLDKRESAIGTLLNKFGENDGTIKENIVQELCESIDSELNLRVIARTTLLLQFLTRRYFVPTDKDAIRSWWEENKDKAKYQSHYKGYLKAIDRIKRGVSTDTDRRDVISFLKETSNAEPNALHTKCLLGGFLALTGDYPNANNEFTEVKNINANYKWLLFWEAVSYMQQDNIDDAIDSLNKALDTSPGPEFEAFARHLADEIPKFKDLTKNPKINWSSKIIKK